MNCFKKILTMTALTTLLIVPNFVHAGDSKIYVATLSTGYYHTGMAIPLSALFYKNVDNDTVWQYMGRPNNRIFKFDLHRKSNGKFIALATHTGIHTRVLTSEKHGK
ncbi:MAG: hypothetical protein GXO74_08790 [Calditrichaeota bacterium]|nr:hypothetical protein [Calditrichota bacterium]